MLYHYGDATTLPRVIIFPSVLVLPCWFLLLLVSDALCLPLSFQVSLSICLHYGYVLSLHHLLFTHPTKIWLIQKVNATCGCPFSSYPRTPAQVNPLFQGSRAFGIQNLDQSVRNSSERGWGPQGSPQKAIQGADSLFDLSNTRANFFQHTLKGIPDKLWSHSIVLEMQRRGGWTTPLFYW